MLLHQQSRSFNQIHGSMKLKANANLTRKLFEEGLTMQSVTLLVLISSSFKISRKKTLKNAWRCQAEEQCFWNRQLYRYLTFYAVACLVLNVMIYYVATSFHFFLSQFQLVWDIWRTRRILFHWCMCVFCKNVEWWDSMAT